MRPRVVAIDGPAGAGKSTVSRRVAEALRFRYVDTGAMYRVVGVLAAAAGIALDDEPALAALCDGLDLVFEETDGGLRVTANRQDLTARIRSREAASQASKISAIPIVRERLVAKQREMGEGGDVVMEGRDIGTVVFPDAPLKIFLDASPRERAVRRSRDLAAIDRSADIEAIAREIEERDARDRGRAHSPLRPAGDAVIIDSTAMNFDQVVQAVLRLAQSNL